MTRDPRERWMLFVRGFKHGAAGAAIAHPDEPDYKNGYREARKAINAAAAAYAKEVGHVPSVLRSAPAAGSGEPTP